MKFKSLLLLMGVLLSGPLFGQAPKQFEIFDSKAYGISSRMDVLLELTPEQEAKLIEAYEAWRKDPEVLTTQEAFKQSNGLKTPEADAAKKAFYGAQKAARTKYDEVVSEVLTSEQKALVESVSNFARELWSQSAGEENWKVRAAKQKELGGEQIRTILTPDQVARLTMETVEEKPTPAE